MLNWVKQFNIFCYLDNQQYNNKGGYECLVAAGAANCIGDSTPFSEIDKFIGHANDWCFGHLSYSLKNQFFGGVPGDKDPVGFPTFFFFQPQILVRIKGDDLIISAKDPVDIYEAIISVSVENKVPGSISQLKQRLQKEEYVRIIKKLQQHILKGDCYEINFCQEFYANDVDIEPASVFQSLIKTSPTPFSAFYRMNDAYLLCASPERFLKKTGSRIFSQPMKGTAKRSANDSGKDEQLKQALYADAKERAENVMIVDLVRNDLSMVCKEATVKVDELFGVYTFPQVHQMVSSISGDLKADVSFYDIIKATFPMGSMTGAPKVRAMKLIEEYEVTKRGIYSGSFGCISPDGDFDFNVVIRSILYNAESSYLSFQVGGAITYQSNAILEYEECLLKASAILKVLGS